jgi:WD40 repeat protein
MPLSPGFRLGQYEIVCVLGAGGMGEVYRARDTRLNRDVAIKVLPDSLARDPDRLARFEREAQAVAALSHPNILAIHDFQRIDQVTFAVMELLQGESLRERLRNGALPARKAVEIATEIARGLAAAHDRQIVHRDLKPENIFVSTGVKLLDFGLARHMGQQAAVGHVDSPTVAPSTEPGVVLGTVGYMAPEQVRGEPSDHRADIFALGCVLYEMLAGQRAFARDTAAETMAAILREDPPDPAALNVTVPPGVMRTLRRCLEKRPEDRFQSARDLAFALESSLDASSGTLSHAIPPERLWRRWIGAAALIALGGLLGAIGGALISDRSARSTRDAMMMPTYRRLTFDSGTIRDARFTPDGQSVVYSAAWKGEPIRMYLTRADSVESVRLTLPDARMLSISRNGDIALSLGHTYEGWMGIGTLAVARLLGSSARPMLEGIREADWTPDGKELAIVRRQAGLEQLEFPIGTALYKTSGYVSDVRFSPNGEWLAFADHHIYSDDAGTLSIVNRQGQRRVLSQQWNAVRGVAWSPDGSEVWFTASHGGAHGGDSLYATTLEGAVRVVMSGPIRMKLCDVARDGRVLLARETFDRRAEALLAGWTTPRDISIRDSSTSAWIAPDGSIAAIADQSAPEYETYILRAGDDGPIRLGAGQPFALSGDLRWIASLPVSGQPVILHPTGPGQSRRLPNPDTLLYDALGWSTEREVILFGQKPGMPPRGYRQSIDGGPPKAFTPPGVTAARWWVLPIAANGRVTAQNVTGEIGIYHVDGRPPTPLSGLAPGELPIQWTADGRGLYVTHGSGAPRIVERLDLDTGRRTRVLEVMAREKAGLRLSIIAVTPDARYWVHSYARLLSDLFVVEGLK